MDTDTETTKKRWTDEERLKLAEKLDKELDEFISGLEKKPYTEGWPEERWEEEMQKHPFFMKNAPEPGDELHPLYEGLQQLKYDPNENTPEELAISYKDDGNFNFKHKNYRLAIIAYTEGIKIKCNDNEINATLLNNRSAAHYFLKNYRSSLRDCELALKLKSDYQKPLIRAAHCCYEIQQYDKCTDYCDRILNKQKNNKEILELRQKAVKAAKLKERDGRIKERDAKKTLEQQKELLETIACRTGKRIDLSELQPVLPQLEQHHVHLNEEKRLVWPVAFMYPEYKIMDFVQEFCEDETFLDHICNMFEVTPEWDKEKKYKPERLNVYFKNHDTEKVYLIDLKETLGDVLKKKELFIYKGVPSFLLVVKGSKAEEELSLMQTQ